MRKLLKKISIFFLLFSLTACHSQVQSQETITIAAASSLKNTFENELIPLFNEMYPDIKVNGIYDGSGKLETQIEEGLEPDLFMSASIKQVNELMDKGYIDENHELLINKIVLIVPSDLNTKLKEFEDIVLADHIVIGDPESVPAGQYAKEILINIDLWDTVETRLSFGTNVTEVLNQVMEGSAECGIVYATDAASTDKVKIVAEAPEGSLMNEVIYPVAKLRNANECADLFVEFLKSAEAQKIFIKYGFAIK